MVSASSLVAVFIWVAAATTLVALMVWRLPAAVSSSTSPARSEISSPSRPIRSPISADFPAGSGGASRKAKTVDGMPALPSGGMVNAKLQRKA
jgi:hypothetical protein